MLLDVFCRVWMFFIVGVGAHECMYPRLRCELGFRFCLSIDPCELCCRQGVDR